MKSSKKTLLLPYFTDNSNGGDAKVPSLFIKVLIMEIRKVLLAVAEEHLKDDSYFIVDIIVKGSTGGKMKVLILLDADEGVNIDDCADLSRAVGNHVETEELIEQAYTLEVSSPGLEHPLILQRQYVKNISRNLKIQLNDGSMVTGKLESVSDKSIELNKEGKEKKKTVYQLVTIGFDEIEKTNVLVSFK